MQLAGDIKSKMQCELNTTIAWVNPFRLLLSLSLVSCSAYHSILWYPVLNLALTRNNRLEWKQKRVRENWKRLDGWTVASEQSKCLDLLDQEIHSVRVDTTHTHSLPYHNKYKKTQFMRSKVFPILQLNMTDPFALWVRCGKTFHII